MSTVAGGTILPAAGGPELTAAGLADPCLPFVTSTVLRPESTNSVTRAMTFHLHTGVALPLHGGCAWVLVPRCQHLHSHMPVSISTNPSTRKSSLVPTQPQAYQRQCKHSHTSANTVTRKSAPVPTQSHACQHQCQHIHKKANTSNNTSTRK